MNPSETTHVTDRATKAVKWSALMELASRTIQPIVFIVLARLLSPGDFGLVSTVMIITSFAQMFWDAGLSKTLIQTGENLEEAANVVFWTNLSLGLAIYFLLFMTASPIGNFFKSSGSQSILRVLGFQVVIGALASVQYALSVKQLNFRCLFWARFVGAATLGVVSVPLAFCGYGVWALVSGMIAGQTASFVLLWRNSNWRPRAKYNLDLARRMFGFSVWVAAEALGAWVLMWSDNLVVGRFLGPEDLGVYRLVWSICTLIFALALAPITAVLFPAFSRLKDDRETVVLLFHKANRILIAIALPMGAFLFLLGPDAVAVLFDEKWKKMEFVLPIIGLWTALSWTVSANTEVYRAIGRPDANTKIMFAAAAYYLPAYVISAQYGLHAFVYTRFVVGLFSIPLHIFFACRILGVSWAYLLRQAYKIVVATLPLVLMVLFMGHIFGSSLGTNQTILLLIAKLFCGGFVYVFSLWLLDHDFIHSIRLKLIASLSQ